MFALVVDTEGNLWLVAGTEYGMTDTADSLAFGETVDCDYPNASILVVTEKGARLEGLNL